MTRLAMTLAALALLAMGCSVEPREAFHLGFQVLNDANRLLTVEGRTDLPDGVRLEARLQHEDRRIATRRGEVEAGRFFVVLDVGRAPTGERLDLELILDPAESPRPLAERLAPATSRVGGTRAEERGGRRVFVARRALALPVPSRKAGFQAFEQGDYSGGVDALEGWVARNPRDGEALIRLGLAYLARSPRDRMPGSRAHRMLRRALELAPQDVYAPRARAWVQRLDREERIEESMAEQNLVMSRDGLLHLRASRSVVPGESLGGVSLGMKASELFSVLTPERFPDWREGSGPVRVSFPDHYGLEVELDRRTRTVVRIATRSSELELAGGLTIGAHIRAVREWYPDAVPSFGPYRPLPDGGREALGECRTDGLVLEVRREVRPGGLPVDLLSGIAVVPATPRGGPRALPMPTGTVTPAADLEPSPEPRSADPAG